MSIYNVVEVFTNKSTEFMLEYGGSASWIMNRNSARKLEFCVCCRNDIKPREDDPGVRPERRNEAFLVGKVSGIEFVERENDRDRYLIKFSAYAEVSVPDFRRGLTRNPMVYLEEEECLQRGLNLRELDFHPMPPPTKSYSRKKAVAQSSEVPLGLSIADAKEGLALRFGVPTESVHITISA